MLDRWLVSVHTQNERHVLVECIDDALRTSPGHVGVDDVGRVDVSAVLLLRAVLRDRSASASSGAASRRHGASRSGARKFGARENKKHARRRPL